MDTVGDLRKYLKKAERSPEQVALDFHVSNMTVRRLLHKSDSALLPEKYQVLFTSFFSGEKPLARSSVAEETSPSTDLFGQSTPQAAGNNSLLAPQSLLQGETFSSEISALGESDGFKKVLQDLQKNGSAVKNSEELKAAYKLKLKGGGFAKDMLATLKIVSNYAFRGSSLSLRFMCVGAILYFINVFDLIPDTLGPIGYLDDFAVLALVAGQIKKERKNLSLAPQDTESAPL